MIGKTTGTRKINSVSFAVSVYDGRIQARFFLEYLIYQKRSTSPLNMLDIVILHQTPFSPRGVAERARAIGMRAPVRIALTMDGGTVRPRPENAPAVVISMHIKSWETPRICR